MYKIPLTKPYITQTMKDRVCQVLESGMLTDGDVTREFETACRDYIGAEHAIAVTSCTTGLEVALRALNIGHGDEVIIPDFTYPATAHAVRIVGAACVIVDINPETMLINYDQIRKAITPRTKAIIPVSLFGNPLDYSELNDIKTQYNVSIVEDAACAFGASYNGQKVGSLADISVFSFHPRKFVTTGEGGVITTNNSEWARWIRSYKTFGYNRDNGDHAHPFQQSGTNYKMSNVLAAIGLSQLECITELEKKRLDHVRNYMNLLAECDDIDLPSVTLNGRHSYQSFCVSIQNRDKVLETLRNQGIEVQIGTYSLHKQPVFQNDPDNYHFIGDMHGSVMAYESCITLPLYHDMCYEDQVVVTSQLIAAIHQ